MSALRYGEIGNHAHQRLPVLERLREGRPESLETTSLHLDVLRDLKRIHSHICSVSYPVLDAAGEMPIGDAAESDPIMISPTVRKPAVR